MAVDIHTLYLHLVLDIQTLYLQKEEDILALLLHEMVWGNLGSK
jgi:hypothetical protein